MESRRAEKYRRAAYELRNVLCRLAILRNGATSCEISACRRARVCMGERFACIYKPFDPARPMRDDDRHAWNALAQRRQELHRVLQASRCDN